MSSPRKPRRPRVQIDADALDDMLKRWQPYVNDVEYLAGEHFLHALRELERLIPERLDQSWWRR